MWMFYDGVSAEEKSKTVYDLVDEKQLDKHGYKVTRLVIRNMYAGLSTSDMPKDTDIYIQPEYMNPGMGITPYLGATTWFKTVKTDNIIRPSDFEDLKDYGIIYIATHGDAEGIYACPYYINDSKLKNWMESHDCLTTWEDWTHESIYEKDPTWDVAVSDSIYMQTVLKSRYYGLVNTGQLEIKSYPFELSFIKLNRPFFWNQDLSGSLLYINACKSYQFYNGMLTAGLPEVLLGNSINAGSFWSEHLAYYFFSYMMDQYISPNWILYADDGEGTDVYPDPKPDNSPMSAGAAYKALKSVNVNPDPKKDYPEGFTCGGCELIMIGEGDLNNFYLAGDTNISLTKTKLKKDKNKVKP